MRGSSPDGDDPVVQQALRDQTLHKALLEQIDQGVCIVNRDNRILYWNLAAERISGFLAHEVAGQVNHGDLLLHSAHCDALLGLQSCDVEGAPEGKPHASVVLLLHREGYRILVYVQSRPIRDWNGEAIGTMELFDEIAASAHPGVREFEAFGCADTSTRAANRKYGELMARHALEALNTFAIPFGWLRIGLDGAADMDRGFGRGMVEAALKMVAAAIERNLGTHDVLTRWEGAELCVQINRCTPSELAAAAERLCLIVRASCLDWWGDRLRVTISAGGTAAEPGDTLETLDGRASEALEGCRAAGGDRAAMAHAGRSGVSRCSQ
ncbi:MAG TPA: diguanylate cyclase [Bryobacteraceae bacterium]|nr:diguanylate cyclase [Bryobacteraceae bacterium]